MVRKNVACEYIRRTVEKVRQELAAILSDDVGGTHETTLENLS